MKTTASFLRWLSAGILVICLLPLAHAQWSWKDKEGRRVFSDQPPPPSVAEKDILKRPAGARAPAAVVEIAAGTPSTTASSTSTTATGPKISGKDVELEKKKKETEAQEAGKKKAEAEKAAAAKKDNCERAQRSKASFDSGVRISTTNAKGEREIMSESSRAAEGKRLQDIISRDCG